MSKTLPEISKLTFGQLFEKSGMTAAEASAKYGVSLRTLYRWIKGECESSPAYSLVFKNLNELFNSGKVTNAVDQNSFRYIDLFAGIGGFRKAFDAIGGQCVFTSEWDKSCRLTYQANYTCDHLVVGDIREYTKDEESLDRIPKHDVLVGGFPCQPFSIAGVSKKNSLGRAHGFKCDTQGTLFFDLAQIIEHHKPSVILLENVKNLASHDGGKTFQVIKRTLEDELGYFITTRIIDGKSWVPQHRERIFIVGIRKDLNVQIDLKDLVIPAPVFGPKLGTILHNNKEADEAPFVVKGKAAEKYTLSENLWDYLQKYKAKHLAKGNGFGYSLFGPEDIARTLSARYYKDGSEILVNQKGKRPRRLTPRECSRLMGFDGAQESGFKIPVSDTQAYRQFGNSVIVPCAKAVAEYIKPAILEAIRNNSPKIELSSEQPATKRKRA
jgi:DNA (cytosine-5)-methyltransferase 1